MTQHTPFEECWLHTLQELRSNPGIQVMRDSEGPPDLTIEDVLESFDELEDRENITLAPALQENYLRHSEIGSQWKTVGPYAFVTAEFNFTPLARLVHEEPPTFGSALSSAEERRLVSELRVIDEAPVTGTGSFAALRLQPEVEEPEIWFTDGERGIWQMDLGYFGYFEALRLTKGTFGWQYLFTEAPLVSEEFEGPTDRLKNMFESLPQIFPDHDYEPLRARFAERME
ncbi:hypothetical protein ACWC2K_08580 [Streptomyces chattanoogensis]|uniref:hypothetical protein n=1 Tax=Streptomyces chattanoogensis TaxID=66876 RepID=UPI0036ABCE6D